jgi:predicted transcriptional regulator
MPQSVLELAKELTMALIQTENMPPEDIRAILQKTHTTLLTLRTQEETGATTAVPVFETPRAPVNWRKSITRHAVTCLECGKTFKQLNIRHLRQHGLDARSYRTKYTIPQTEPLAARDTTTRRRQLVRETRPWEKAPTYLKGQARKTPASPEPEANAMQEEIEEPGAAASAQPKRQRKTSPKKTARKTRSEG